MTEGFRVEGLNELIADLGKVPLDVRNKMVRSGIRKAMKPIEQETIRRAPVGDTGSLSDSIKLSSSSRGGEVRAKVKADGKQAPHAHLVEFGHHIRGKKDGPSHGFVKAHPFIRPAFDTKVNESLKILAEEVGDSLDKTLKK